MENEKLSSMEGAIPQGTFFLVRSVYSQRTVSSDETKMLDECFIERIPVCIFVVTCKRKINISNQVNNNAKWQRQTSFRFNIWSISCKMSPERNKERKGFQLTNEAMRTRTMIKIYIRSRRQVKIINLLWKNWSHDANLPNLCAKDSTYQADPMPTRSEIVLPRAAAAMVEMPSFMPRDSSMYSPAMIITKLSRKPNPTKGRELWYASCRRSAELGTATPPSRLRATFFSSLRNIFLSSTDKFCIIITAWALVKLLGPGIKQNSVVNE